MIDAIPQTGSSIFTKRKLLGVSNLVTCQSMLSPWKNWRVGLKHTIYYNSFVYWLLNGEKPSFFINQAMGKGQRETNVMKVLDKAINISGFVVPSNSIKFRPKYGDLFFGACHSGSWGGSNMLQPTSRSLGTQKISTCPKAWDPTLLHATNINQCVFFGLETWKHFWIWVQHCAD